jgi:hypothetical protein
MKHMQRFILPVASSSSSALKYSASKPRRHSFARYANCDGSTVRPILTVDNFTCFINEFAAGCPGC